MIKKVIKIFLLVANIFSILWLLMCVYASYYDSSAGASFITLFPFSLPFALLANVLFVGAWLVFTKKKKWYAVFSLIAILISWPVSKAVVGFNPGGSTVDKNQVSTEKRFKIITYNVHMFDLGGWTKDNTTQRRIVDFIKDESPDILCLQEYYMDKNDNKAPFTETIANLGYAHFEFTRQSYYKKKRMTSKATETEMVEVGIAVFSKYPLHNKTDINIPSNGSEYYKCMLTDVAITDDTKLKLLVTHLQSFSLGNSEREFIEQVKVNTETARQQKEETKNLLKKLMYASSIRAQQVNVLKDVIKGNKDQPFIICGDFNDIPGSYVYRTIARELADPFITKGFGMGRTFRSIAPTLRIDHIMYDDSKLKAISYKIISQNLSDHNPVSVEFTLKK